MGLIRFLVHPPERVTAEAAQQAYFAGPDDVPWPTRTRITATGLAVEWPVNDSGHFSIPWPVAGRGELTLYTASLMERSSPYHLQVELARGTLNAVRAQWGDWVDMGLKVPPTATAKLREANERFSLAATAQHDPAQAAILAEAALETALAAGDQLLACYVEQALAVRRRNAARAVTLCGVNLGHVPPSAPVAKQIAATFDAAIVPLNWRQVEAVEGKYHWQPYDDLIEWCQQRQWPVLGGPLLALDGASLPDWLYLWEGDFDNLFAVVSDYIETTVARYKGRVQLWQAAARLAEPRVLSLAEDEKLRLVVRTIEIVRQADPEVPVFVGFDQPWGERLHRSNQDFPPLHVADALVRAGLGLAGLNLELNVAYNPLGSQHRPALALSRLVDRWSGFGLPLFITLTCPGGEGPDPRAVLGNQLNIAEVPGGWTPQQQRAWIERIVPLLMAKPAVRGVLWNQLSDAQPHDFPHGGLFDAGDRAKPGLAAWAAARKRLAE